MAATPSPTHTETLFSRETGTFPAFYRATHAEMQKAGSPAAARIDALMANLDRLESACGGNESSADVLLAGRRTVYAFTELRKDMRARQGEIIGADDFLAAHAVGDTDLSKAIANAAYDAPAVRQEIHAAESEGRPPIIRPQQMIGWPHPLGRLFMSKSARRAGEAQAKAAAESLRQTCAQAAATKKISALRDPLRRGAELEVIEAVERYVAGFERAMVLTSMRGRDSTLQLKALELALSSGRLVDPELNRAIEDLQAADRPAAERWKAHREKMIDRELRLSNAAFAAHLGEQARVRTQRATRGECFDLGLTPQALLAAKLAAARHPGKPKGPIWHGDGAPKPYSGPLRGANDHPDHPNYAANMAALAAKRARRSPADRER